MKYSNKKASIKFSTKGDRLFYQIVNIIAGLVLIVILYPLIYIVSSSFSSPNAVLSGKVIFLPVEPSLEGYKAVLQYPAVLTGYVNSIVYMAIGTSINVSLTMMCAYGLSRNDMPFRNFFMFLFTFTMYFSGGLIPNYILMRDLNLINHFLAIILPGAISVYNMIIARTFIQNTIPKEMLEAAKMDGCSDIRYFFQMLLPLSKAILAVITLYYAVGHWNAWFDAFIYLNDREKYPLQLVLREILISNQVDNSLSLDADARKKMQGMVDLMKYSLIVISSLPIMCIYPFVQKYFTQGVMIGSLKG
ncbi:MAG: carbohydrate ABC transporter permease [Clostridiales bacterium]|nr:carbohydrate ABC transporter permease [Clostridiales bacterium]